MKKQPTKRVPGKTSSQRVPKSQLEAPKVGSKTKIKKATSSRAKNNPAVVIEVRKSDLQCDPAEVEVINEEKRVQLDSKSPTKVEDRSILKQPSHKTTPSQQHQSTHGGLVTSIEKVYWSKRTSQVLAQVTLSGEQVHSNGFLSGKVQTISKSKLRCQAPLPTEKVLPLQTLSGQPTQLFIDFMTKLIEKEMGSKVVRFTP